MLKIIKTNVAAYNADKEGGSYMGNPKSEQRSKRELVGYMPMEKRITALMAAGLRTAAQKDVDYYDSIKQDDDLPIPPIPRHFPADLAEMSEHARHYAERRREIEDRVKEARQKRLEAFRASQNSPGGGTPPGTGLSAPREPAADTPVAP